jgi:hypothetical protein
MFIAQPMVERDATPDGGRTFGSKPSSHQQIPILRLPDGMTRQWQAPPHKLDVTAS